MYKPKYHLNCVDQFHFIYLLAVICIIHITMHQIKLVLINLVIVVSSLWELKPVTSQDFNYIPGDPRGPERWGYLKEEWATCRTGQRQSPINLPFVPLYKTPRGLNTRYVSSNATVLNRGYEISVCYFNQLCRLKSFWKGRKVIYFIYICSFSGETIVLEPSKLMGQIISSKMLIGIRLPSIPSMALGSTTIFIYLYMAKNKSSLLSIYISVRI